MSRAAIFWSRIEAVSHVEISSLPNMAPFPLSFPSVSYGQAAVAVGTLYALYLVGLGIYRLFFHPLRHVPGPKLAALTQWVETYYECFKPPGGQFMWAYQRWHEKYGKTRSRCAPDGSSTTHGEARRERQRS